MPPTAPRGTEINHGRDAADAVVLVGIFSVGMFDGEVGKIVSGRSDGKQDSRRLDVQIQEV